jgi:hypothetical protein
MMWILTTQIQGLSKFKMNDQIVEKNITSIASIAFQNAQYIQIILNKKVLGMRSPNFKNILQNSSPNSSPTTWNRRECVLPFASSLTVSLSKTSS